MEVDRARTRGRQNLRNRRVQCYRCRQYGHFARDCTASVDIRVAHVENNLESSVEGHVTKKNDKEDFPEAEED